MDGFSTYQWEISVDMYSYKFILFDENLNFIYRKIFLYLFRGFPRSRSKSIVRSVIISEFAPLTISSYNYVFNGTS